MASKWKDVRSIIAIMIPGSPHWRHRLTSNRALGGAIFVLTFLVFWFSPAHQVTDSTYSMLLSQSLLKHHSFTLDSYPALAPVEARTQLKLVNNHIYHYHPVGGSVLSIPFVAILNAFGVSAANPDGTYNLRSEVRMQAIIAAVLMALLAGVFFFTSRLALPLAWSVVIALSGAFGTQVWSTASRALWSHTWEMVLLGIAIWMLLAAEIGKHKLRPAVLATLLAWAYFARPTSAIPIFAISFYILLFHRRIFLPYALVGAVWAIGFAIFSWIHFGHFLPSYYRHPVPYDQFWTALFGNLVSPSRGLLVYVPVLFFLIYLLVRHWKQIAFKRLVWLVLFIALTHLITISGSTTWWGGGCYGARMTADLVPWFVLIGILAVSAMLRWRAQPDRKRSVLNGRVPLVAGSLLLVFSVLINARGAIPRDTWETWRWNRPDKDTHALWEWRYPQFLAGLIRPPLPEIFPPAETHIDLTSADSSRYLWYGWSGPEPEFRWTDGHEATIIFALDQIGDTTLEMQVGAFLAGRITEQDIKVTLNGQPIGTLRLGRADLNKYSVLLPGNLLRRRNVLRFNLPNASSLNILDLGEDPRLLGVKIEWIEFHPAIDAQ